MSRRRRTGRRLGILGTWFLGGVALVLIVAVAGFYSLSDVKTPDQIVTDQTAAILYADGSSLAKIGVENRTDVKIADVPAAVKWAVLAAEDRGYYSEPGISITGTLRAAYNDLTGGSTQGGSGITQQYVKNAYLSDSQTVTRKLKELAIAVKLDRNYAKDKILEYYLNTIYFGRGAYGIQAAAQTYFNADVGKLDVGQAAVLAASIRSPADYDPATNPGPAKARWQYVLDGMVKTGHLTAAQQQAVPYPVVQPPGDNGLGAVGNSAFIVQQVKDELERDGIKEEVLNTRGLTITTTLQVKAQAAADAAIGTVFGSPEPYQADIKKAIVAVEPSTGAVLAYHGGANDKSDQQDYAGVTCQGPGSSFKPYTLAVGLTNALQRKTPGYSLNSVVNGSSPQTIDGTVIANDPSDRQYSSSRITVARAMEVSLNTVFDGMASKVGPDNVAAMAHSAGIAATCGGVPTLVNVDANGKSTGQTDFGIGIGDYNVRTIDQAVGYATIANGGTTHPAYFVSKVTAADGSVLFEHHDAGTRSMDPKVANDLAVSIGPVAQFSGNSLAGSRASGSKTGTVGIEACRDGGNPATASHANGNCDAVGQNSDAWTVGFTPSVSVAVWAGSGNRTTPIYAKGRSSEYGRDLPGRTWKAFLDTYLAGTPNQPLPTKAEVTGGQNVAPTFTPRPTSVAPPTTAAPVTPPPTVSSSTPTPPPTPTAPPTPIAPVTPISPTPPVVVPPTAGTPKPVPGAPPGAG